jgi:hypothetical protein
MPILVGIDGTGGGVNPGASRDRAYDQDFVRSFVRRICNGKANAMYFRGPVTLGGGLPEAIAGGVAFINQRRVALPSEPILLTGYSRGAAGVVVIAERLKAQGIPVRAMMLFDCVDRHLAFDASAIPNNVEHVKHVIRNPAARSRMSFGNDGMNYSPPTNYVQPTIMYMCTHGGMGGTPWPIPAGSSANDYINEGIGEALLSPTRREPVWTYRTNVTYAQDRAVSGRIWGDVQPFLRTHGF